MHCDAWVRHGRSKGVRVQHAYQQTQKHLYNLCTMLGQRRRRWNDVVQMLYKCFVFAGMHDMHT